MMLCAPQFLLCRYLCFEMQRSIYRYKLCCLSTICFHMKQEYCYSIELTVGKMVKGSIATMQFSHACALVMCYSSKCNNRYIYIYIYVHFNTLVNLMGSSKMQNICLRWSCLKLKISEQISCTIMFFSVTVNEYIYCTIQAATFPLKLYCYMIMH